MSAAALLAMPVSVRQTPQDRSYKLVQTGHVSSPLPLSVSNNGGKGIAMLGTKTVRKLHTTEEIAAELASALRRGFRNEKHALKRIAGWTGAGLRAVKNWTAGTNPPHAAHLIALMRESDEVFETVCRLADRSPATLTNQQKSAIRAALRALEGTE